MLPYPLVVDKRWSKQTQRIREQTKQVSDDMHTIYINTQTYYCSTLVPKNVLTDTTSSALAPHSRLQRQHQDEVMFKTSQKVNIHIREHTEGVEDEGRNQHKVAVPLQVTAQDIR
jgi:gas vesicle protein